MAIHELRLPMTRLYAVGDEPFSLESAIVLTNHQGHGQAG